MKFPETTWGIAAKTYAFTLFATLLCFFLHMSITMVFMFAGTERLGVRSGGVLEDGRTLVVEEMHATEETPAHRKIYIIENDNTETVLADHDVLDSEDTDEELLLQYPITQGYSENIRAEADPSMKRFTEWLAQILMAIVFLAFPYSNLWYVGDRDRNNAQFGHIVGDKLRGLKIGLLASIPAAAAWLLLVAGKLTGGLQGYVKWYRWINFAFQPIFNACIPSVTMDPAEVTWVAILVMAGVLCVLPLVTGIGYFLGYSEISVRDKMVYAATGKRVKRRRRK